MTAGIEISPFGVLPDGTGIDLYTLTDANGLSCKIITYGGTLVEIQAPDRDQKLANVVLGYDRLEDYFIGNDYRGAIVGRVANRIRGASFELNGNTFFLTANEGLNHLHGGSCGFDKRVWKAIPSDGPVLRLGCESADGEEGYPGNLKIQAEWKWGGANDLSFTCTATTDQPTPVNLTGHPYWNLAGGGDILQHELKIAADCYTPLDGQNIPTGKIEPVAGTLFDFRSPSPIGARTSQYNANYALNVGRGMVQAARVLEPKSGRVLEVSTNQPGLQFYTGAFLPQPFTGFCLEAQNFPDAVHHSHFPSCILAPGDTYIHRTTYRFTVS